VYELANERLSVVSDRTVIYCLFMGSQACLMENLQEPIRLSVKVLLILFMLVLNMKCDDMFSRTSRSTTGPTQPPIQWLWGFFPGGGG
jgi:hypothetical protein